MIVDLDKSVIDNIDDKQCVYTCKEPGGSLIVSVVVAMTGIILIPAFLSILDGTYPFTTDGFLWAVVTAASVAIGYTMPIPAHYYVFYFAFTFIGGMTCIKQSKSIALPLISLAISILAFFFIALFVLGISIVYTAFFTGIGIFMIPFAVSIVVPSLLGGMASKGLISAKKCFMRGKGVAVNA